MKHFLSTNLSSVNLPRYYDFNTRNMIVFRPDLLYNKGNQCTWVVGPVLNDMFWEWGVHGEFINGLT